MAAAHRCTILVVDDDEGLREIVRVALELDGYAVVTAVNGQEALRVLRSSPDVCAIVLDLMLPLMDGETFREAQLRDRSLAWIPVIVLSGTVDATLRARALHVQDVVRKPVDVDALRRALRQIGCRHAVPAVSDDARQAMAELAARKARR
jgi:CheY-like chemotaxis protein